MKSALIHANVLQYKQVTHVRQVSSKYTIDFTQDLMARIYDVSYSCLSVCGFFTHTYIR